jgi:flagellar biosynthesis/type III secretory pathway chaperone
VCLMNDLLQQKHSLYRRLKANLEGYKKALAKAPTPQIVELTQEREEILKAIDLLDVHLARAGYPGRPSVQPEKKGNTLMANWLNKIKETWQEIFNLNLECLQFAEVRCRDLRQEMATLGREVQGVKNYIPPRPYAPRFVDMVE